MLLALTALGAGCANLSEREQRTLSGGAIGAVGGAAITAVAGGGIIIGALIGAGAGAAIGALTTAGK